MAFCSDNEWVLSHIYNSFITSDDTGVCEMVMSAETQCSTAPLAEPAGDQVDGGGGLTDPLYLTPHSPEISMESGGGVMAAGGHRRRSNTSQRLDQMQKQRRNAARCRQIMWRPAPAVSGNLSEVFVERAVSCDDAPCNVSLLTEQLRNVDIVDNPFAEFAKYDGRAHLHVPTRRIAVFPTMSTSCCESATDGATEEEDDADVIMPGGGGGLRPLSVCVVASARVCDVVGLVCWQYLNENRQPPLSAPADEYCLFLAEDDGEVDWDFPPLDGRETVAKFGFNVLALVHINKLLVTVEVDGGVCDSEPLQLSLNSRNLTVSTVVHAALTQLHMTQQPTDHFGLTVYREDRVWENERREFLSDATLLADLSSVHFVLWRREEACFVPTDTTAGCASGGCSVGVSGLEEGGLGGLLASVTASVYQTFNVHQLSSRLGLSTAVLLGVSGERLEIDPVHGGGAGGDTMRVTSLLSRCHAVTHQITSVVDCCMVDVKYGGRAVFRITVCVDGRRRRQRHLRPFSKAASTVNDPAAAAAAVSYKHLSFEADIGTAKSVVRKLQLIIDSLASCRRREFVELTTNLTQQQQQQVLRHGGKTVCGLRTTSC